MARREADADKIRKKTRKKLLTLKFLLITIKLYTVVFFVKATTLSTALQHQKGKRLHTIVRINEFENCKDRPQRPFRLLSSEIYVPAKNVYALKADGVSEKATRFLEKLIVNITKCADRSKQHCEHFQRIEWKPKTVICPLFVQSSLSPWFSIIKAFNPPFQCAYPQGKFTVRNMTVDNRAISNLPIPKDNNYWVAHWEIFDESFSPWCCFVIETDMPKVHD